MKALIIIILVINCGRYMPPKYNKSVSRVLLLRELEKGFCIQPENEWLEQCEKFYKITCHDDGEEINCYRELR
jgi:hypothetical protein